MAGGYVCKILNVVSLFTREWIEIDLFGVRKSDGKGLPLYEGVD